MDVISVKNLKKYYQVYSKESGFLGGIKSFFNRKYSTVKAVDGISFEIKEGELVGFIGPNGAGKTTTLKVLSGLLYPTAGEVKVLGFEPFKRQKPFQMNISLVMGQKNQLWWDLPAIDSFILYKEIYEISKERFKDTLNKLSRMLKVQDLLTTPVRKLSLGQRMKLELIAALLHCPKVLFLDEPTIGLDVVAQRAMRDFIKEYNQEFRATILLTSHYMGDVKELCKRVIIINEGKIIYDGPLLKIVNKFAPYKIIKVDSENGEHQTVRVKKAEVAKKVQDLLTSFEVADLTVEDPPIEDVIREIFESS